MLRALPQDGVSLLDRTSHAHKPAQPVLPRCSRVRAWADRLTGRAGWHWELLASVCNMMGKAETVFKGPLKALSWSLPLLAGALLIVGVGRAKTVHILWPKPPLWCRSCVGSDCIAAWTKLVRAQLSVSSPRADWNT